MNKVIFFFILPLLMIASCSKDDHISNFPATVRFDISCRMLEGKRINCIDFDTKGNIYIASGKEIYYKNSSDQKTYNIDYSILDIAIAPDETLWIGTNGGGLGHMTDKGITWYTSNNSGLPRDYVRNVEIAPNGNIWFSSCAFRLGGLGVYDGEKFEFYTPENSPLNQNIIDDIEIDEEGNIYIATSGTVGKSNIYRISEKSWDCLGDERGTFYWVFSLTIGPAGIIYLVEDFSLSSTFHTSNTLFQLFNDNEWNKIDATDILGYSFFTRIKADKRNYCWIADFGDNSPILRVYDGESWLSSPEGIFPEDYITVIEVDSENNIWVGTSQNGVFILNQ